MNILDIIILICLVPAVIQGIRKGFIAQFVSIISIIIGVWASATFADLLGGWLSQYFTISEQTLKLIAFVIILVAVIVGLILLGKAIEALVKLATLGWINRLLGVLFAILKCMLILGVISILFEALNDTFGFVSEEYINDSPLYKAVKWIADLIFPYIKVMLAAN